MNSQLAFIDNSKEVLINYEQQLEKHINHDMGSIADAEHKLAVVQKYLEQLDNLNSYMLGENGHLISFIEQATFECELIEADWENLLSFGSSQDMSDEEDDYSPFM